VGSFHDEVLKYCQQYGTLDKEDRGLIPMDDFDDVVTGNSMLYVPPPPPLSVTVYYIINYSIVT
jgi:hypothetical protein